MIRPSQAWCIQIDVTTVCHLHCSNCTRLLEHLPNYFMSFDVFEQAINSVYTFPTASEPCPQGRRKVVGIIGGEPLLHPQFDKIVDMMCEKVPHPAHRGLWTSMDWHTYESKKWGPARPLVEKLLGLPAGHDGGGLGGTHRGNHPYGYLNWNMHLPVDNCHHQPLLVSANSTVRTADGEIDHKTVWGLVEKCWVQRDWSPTFTNKGFYFCEVSAHMDRTFQDQNHAIPFGHECWRGVLDFHTDDRGVRQPSEGPFQGQILAHCGRHCGACVPVPGRRDMDEIDDMSQDNYDELVQIGTADPKKMSRAIKHDKVFVWPSDARYDPANAKDWMPQRYKKGLTEGLPILSDAPRADVVAPTSYPSPAPKPAPAPQAVAEPAPAGRNRIVRPAKPSAPPPAAKEVRGQKYDRVMRIRTLPNGQRVKQWHLVPRKK